MMPQPPDAPPPTVVVFDVGNVLVRWDRSLPFRDHFADEAALQHFLDEVIPLSWHGRHDAGEPAAALVAERSAQFPDHAGLIGAWFSRFNESIPGPVAGMPQLVTALAARQVPLFAMTNFGADTWAGFWPTFPLFGLFADIFVSGVEKLAKPDPRAFAAAARRFGHDPATMLLIDDSMPNVVAARECGWHAHHFHDAATLDAELTALGLLE